MVTANKLLWQAINHTLKKPWNYVSFDPLKFAWPFTHSNFKFWSWAHTLNQLPRNPHQRMHTRTHLLTHTHTHARRHANTRRHWLVAVISRSPLNPCSMLFLREEWGVRWIKHEGSSPGCHLGPLAVRRGKGSALISIYMLSKRGRRTFCGPMTFRVNSLGSVFLQWNWFTFFQIRTNAFWVAQCGEQGQSYLCYVRFNWEGGRGNFQRDSFGLVW